MTPSVLYLLAAAGLFALGFYGLLSQAGLLRKVLALGIMSNAVFLCFIALAYRAPQALPDAAAAVDPVSQALVLTGIVVAISATAFALALIRRLYQLTGSTLLAEDRAEAED